MVTPGIFTAKFAEAVGIPEVTVGVHARKLREAKLMTTGGRGRSAPNTVPLDAARLLISVLYSPESPSRAVEAVRDFGKLRFQSQRLQDRVPAEIDQGIAEKYSLFELIDIPRDHAFEEIICALIEFMIADGSIFNNAKKEALQFVGQCDISITPNKLRADISAIFHDYTYNHALLTSKNVGRNIRKTEYHSLIEADYFDLRERHSSKIMTTRSIDGATLMSIADIFRGAAR